MKERSTDGHAIKRRRSCGNPALKPLILNETLFEADAMYISKRGLLDMSNDDLKDELGARGESKAGTRPWLLRRLHGSIVADHAAETSEGAHGGAAFDEVFGASSSEEATASEGEGEGEGEGE